MYEQGILCINRACEHFLLCSTYEIKASNEIKKIGYQKIHHLIGCPSMNEDPNNCSFYKEMCKYKEIDRSFHK